MHLRGDGGLEEETSKMFKPFLEKTRGNDPALFQGVCLNDIPIVENLVHVNIFLYYKDIVHGGLIEELARRTVVKRSNNVQLLRYNSHIRYVSNIKDLVKADQCPSCDQFFVKTGNLERQLTACSERIEHVYPKNVSQIHETLCDKRDSFCSPYTHNKKLSNNMANFALDQFVSKMLFLGTLKQRHRLGSTSQFRY